MLAQSAIAAFLLVATALGPVPSDARLASDDVLSGGVADAAGGGIDFEEEERAFFAPTKSSPSLGPVLTAKSSLVVDRKSGSILYANDQDVVRAPASLTKIMTAMATLESDAKLEDRVLVDDVSSSRPGASMHLETGDELTVHELLRGSLIASGNDAATQLARSVAGEEEAFVKRMNALSEDFGLTSTSFRNPTGLDADGHLSSARDLVRLFDIALEEPAFRSAISVAAHDAPLLNGEDVRVLKTTNVLLRDGYPRIFGGKTGFTDDAGYCLIVLATDDEGNEIIAVTLGSDSSDDRFQDMKSLVTWTFSSYDWKASF